MFPRRLFGRARKVPILIFLVRSSYVSVVKLICPREFAICLRILALIIRLAKQFPGWCWHNYDRVFRFGAAALNLKNWRQINPDLYHYHTSVGIQNNPSPQANRPSDQYATILCRSWNSGACSSPREFCRFRHRCDRNGRGGRENAAVVLGTRQIDKITPNETETAHV